MKFAHSILLGEDVQAIEVDYPDTAGFQIVCPCCAESVIKVRRQLGDGRASDFFSHRQGDPLRNAECEIRVASMSPTDRRHHDVVGREQTMAAFQGVLRQVMELNLDVKGVRDHRSSYARLTKNFYFESMVEGALDWLRNEQAMSARSDALSPSKSEGSDAERVLHGVSRKFEDRVSRRCADTMTAHLLTNQGRSNLRRLYGYAVMCVTAGVHELRRDKIRFSRGHLPPIDHTLMLRAIWHPNPKKAVKNFEAARQAGDPHSRHNLAELFGRTVNMEMALFLRRLPYLRMFENHRRGLTVTDGLESFLRERELSLAAPRKPRSPAFEAAMHRLDEAFNEATGGIFFGGLENEALVPTRP